MQLDDVLIPGRARTRREYATAQGFGSALARVRHGRRGAAAPRLDVPDLGRPTVAPAAPPGCIWPAVRREPRRKAANGPCDARGELRWRATAIGDRTPAVVFAADSLAPPVPCRWPYPSIYLSIDIRGPFLDSRAPTEERSYLCRDLPLARALDRVGRWQLRRCGGTVLQLCTYSMQVAAAARVHCWACELRLGAGAACGHTTMEQTDNDVARERHRVGRQKLLSYRRVRPQCAAVHGPR
jgi:hypothetical protein